MPRVQTSSSSDDGVPSSVHAWHRGGSGGVSSRLHSPRDAAGPSADVDDSKVDAREHVDLGVGFSPAVKEEPAEDALDDEEETEDAAARMERSEDPERPERARRRMAARERKAESARATSDETR